jgi:hypothetical protein
MIYPRIYEANPATDNPTPTVVLGARTTAHSDALGFHPWTPPFPVRDSKRTEFVRGTLHPARAVRGKHSASLLRSEDIGLEERKLEPKTDVGIVKSKRPFSLTHNRYRRTGGGWAMQQNGAVPCTVHFQILLTSHFVLLAEKRWSHVNILLVVCMSIASHSGYRCFSLLDVLQSFISYIVTYLYLIYLCPYNQVRHISLSQIHERIQTGTNLRTVIWKLVANCTSGTNKIKFIRDSIQSETKGCEIDVQPPNFFKLSWSPFPIVSAVLSS